MVWFRRPAYTGGNSSGTVPVWHKQAVEVRSGIDPHVALCGYVYSPSFNGWRAPQHRQHPAAAGRCKKCSRKEAERG